MKIEKNEFRGKVSTGKIELENGCKIAVFQLPPRLLFNISPEKQF
jgi:hypothetical protein